MMPSAQWDVPEPTCFLKINCTSLFLIALFCNWHHVCDKQHLDIDLNRTQATDVTAPAIWSTTCSSVCTYFFHRHCLARVMKIVLQPLVSVTLVLMSTLELSHNKLNFHTHAAAMIMYEELHLIWMTSQIARRFMLCWPRSFGSYPELHAWLQSPVRPWLLIPLQTFQIAFWASCASMGKALWQALMLPTHWWCPQRSYAESTCGGEWTIRMINKAAHSHRSLRVSFVWVLTYRYFRDGHCQILMPEITLIRIASYNLHVRHTCSPSGGKNLRSFNLSISL